MRISRWTDILSITAPFRVTGGDPGNVSVPPTEKGLKA